MALNTAQLTWDANTEPDLQGYIVTATLGTSLFTTSAILLTNSYVFTLTVAFPDGLWRFSVAAIDNTNNSSGQSLIVSKRMIRSTGSMSVKR